MASVSLTVRETMHVRQAAFAVHHVQADAAIVHGSVCPLLNHAVHRVVSSKRRHGFDRMVHVSSEELIPHGADSLAAIDVRSSWFSVCTSDT